MKRVFDNRDSWRRLGDFILRETLILEIEAPLEIPFSGFRREYAWYVRDDVAVRSPVRFDGVDISERRRRDYEENWLRQDARRRRQHDDRVHQETSGGPVVAGTRRPNPTRPEPQFIEDAYYFTEFDWEQGSTYFAGRETLAGREVVRIEHYPSNQTDGEQPDSGEGASEDPVAQRLSHGFNKTSLVTLWIDPHAHQVVKYTFDNPRLDFLPLRWLARVDAIEAVVEMTLINDVSLPARITMSGQVTTALGDFQMTLTRELSDYREAETGARLLDREGR